MLNIHTVQGRMPLSVINHFGYQNLMSSEIDTIPGLWIIEEGEWHFPWVTNIIHIYKLGNDGK